MADESKNSKQIQSSTEAHRSYLQRSEVRLSTMHRIAGSFLGGAGLLLLLPAFFRDPLTIVIAMFFKYAPPVTAAWDLGTTYGTMLLSIPILVAFLIPVWAFWLLLKDLTHFYFTANIPNSGELEKAGQDPAFHPRFSLMALSPADDECGEEKPKIRARQFNTPMRYFVLPHSAVDKAWLTKLVETRDGGRVALARDDKQLVECDDCDDKDRLRMAFGLAGVHNRDLIDEVAIAELSQVRHNLYLRRLVIRYMKAMLILIWTLLVTFIVSALVSSGPTAPPPSYFMLVVAIGFLVWSSLAPVFLRAPVRWIYELFNQHVPNKTQDLHLTQFERRVIYVCLFASICGSMSIAFLGFWPAVILSPIIPCMALAKSYGGLQTKYFDWL